MQSDDEIRRQAKRYINTREARALVERCVGEGVCVGVEKPFTIFMAGSPGAGKTEWSKNIMASEQFSESGGGIARIDADEFRKDLPGYNGTNSDLFQEATSALVDRAYKHALKHRKNCILDTTFSVEGYARRNVGAAINLSRDVAIVYVFQEPEKAWRATQVRERVEGRTIPPDAFVKAFMGVPKIVDGLKVKYGPKIELNFVWNDSSNPKNVTVSRDVKGVEKMLRRVYTEDELKNIVGLYE